MQMYEKKIDRTEVLELYRSMLPHGAQKEIARRSGVSRVAVSQFLSGQYNSDKIENTLLDYYIEYMDQKNERLRKAGLLL